MSLFEILILSAIIIGFLTIALILFYAKQSTQFSQTHNSKDRLLEYRNNQIHELKTDLKEKDKQLIESIKGLNLSRQKLQEEQERVKEEAKEKQKIEKENLDRIWKEHEDNSKEFMKSVCKRNELSYYTNTQLPPDFSERSIEPDFMIEIIGQYVIFDPKFSKSKNINNYINSQVKSTAEKYKNSSDIIFPFIFFVVPTVSIDEINGKYSYKDGNFYFYVITVGAFEPIIRTLKKLEDYDFAKDIHPENREKIIQSIAGMSRHIKEQNAVNLLGTVYGLKTLNELESLPQDIRKAVISTEEKTSFETFKIKEMQKLRNSKEKQKKMLIGFIEPQEPAMKLDDIAIAEENRKKSLED